MVIDMSNAKGNISFWSQDYNKFREALLDETTSKEELKILSDNLKASSQTKTIRYFNTLSDMEKGIDEKKA